MIPDWVWRLYEPYLRKEAERRGMARPLTRELAGILAEFWPECSARLMVQEPWMGTIRFKRLAKYDAESVLPLAAAPEAYIREHFGGGKFKVNFYHGMNFVSTKNFKPEGPPIWKDVPALEED
jgi:hypothetical protein